jgi:proteasome lid subunit RPN8/RPN11
MRSLLPLLALLLVRPVNAPAGASNLPAGDSLTTIVLARPVLDSMNLIFTRANEHWNELADLNWMERNLGTVRPTQREFLGCLLGEVRGDTVVVDDWTPARNMKRLMLAVTGDCSGLPRYVGTFHNHPYLADSQNRATKQRFLAPQDLQSFEASSDLVALMIWDPDSVDAALRTPSGGIVREQPVLVR